MVAASAAAVGVARVWHGCGFVLRFAPGQTRFLAQWVYFFTNTRAFLLLF